MLNDEFVDGLVSLLPAHLLWSNSLLCARALSVVAVLSVGTFLKTNISQGKCDDIF